MASVGTTTIRTVPHRRLSRPEYMHDEDDECSSEEEEELLPPPESWFSHQEEEQDDDSVNSVNEESYYSPYITPSNIVIDAAPSWKELTQQVLPAAARELLSSSMRRVYHYSLLSYAQGRWTRRYSDLNNEAGGYFRKFDDDKLPPFSSLPWVDRQLVQEWRTCDLTFENNELQQDDDDFDFENARTLCPQPHPKPKWQMGDACFDCHKAFGPTRLRHHCRVCGKSFCQVHSSSVHKLPHFGYDAHVPERVCDLCKRMLVEQNLAERVAWRLARCRDHLDGDLTPYFETGVDTLEEVASRVTKAAIALAKSIPLGAQAHVAVETLDVLRKHGLKGIYGLILRKEFMAAADLLCRALGINKTAWPLSVHELSAAIFYALAQHRAMRGMSPEREHQIHWCKKKRGDDDDAMVMEEANILKEKKGTVISNGEEGTDWGPFVSAWTGPARPEATLELGALPKIHKGEDGSDDAVNKSTTLLVDETDTYDPMAESVADLIAMADNALQSHNQTINNGGATVLSEDPLDTAAATDLPFAPVCEAVSGPVISSLIFYAPIALNFVYAEREVDMQLLAAQQGWRLLYAHLDQDSLDRPASALFVHAKQKIACFAVRGTATINDVVTDIRQMPVPFPEMEEDRFEDDWTPVFRGQGLAVCGMAKAAVTLYREHIDSLVLLAENGYRLRITGHSLGGGVATLLGALVLRHIENMSKIGDSLGQAMRSSSSENAPSDSVVVQRNDLLRVYGYGTPSCVDAKLSDYVKTFVTTVVLHDDVVPRLTPTSIRGLLKHLLHIRETWVKAHLTDDLMAITERARTVWAPRWRGSFTISKSSSTSFKRYCRKQIQIGKRKLLTVHGQLVGSIKEDENSLVEEVDRGQNGTPSAESSTIIFCGGRENATLNEHKPEQGPILDYYEKSSSDERESFQDLSFDSEPEARLMVDYMGGIDYRTQGVVIDGDEFFDADESLLEDDEDEGQQKPVVERENKSGDSPIKDGIPDPALDDNVESLEQSENSLQEESVEDNSQTNCHASAFPETRGSDTAEDDWARFDTSFDEQQPGSRLQGAKESAEADVSPFGTESGGLEEGEGDEAGAVILDEAPLPRMFLPGKIVHIYTHRGGYKAAYVPRAFRELRRISLAGNMLSDHTSKAYYEALLEVQDVRKAQEGLPRWTAFDEDDTCSCCASRFTWASTSDTEAQEARDKHNCRSCGTLVCNPCSPNRIPLPSIGITSPVRVCDRCYNDMGGVLTGHSGHALTSSFMESGEEPSKVLEMNSLPEEGAHELEKSADLAMSPVPMASEVRLTDGADSRPERQRERRSKVVDELASRIHSSSVLSSASG